MQTEQQLVVETKEQEDEVEAFDINGLDELKRFQSELQKSQATVNAVFFAARDAITTEGASLIVAGAEINQGVLNRLGQRMENGLLQTISIKKDEALLSSVRELLKHHLLAVLKLKKDEDDIIFHLCSDAVKQLTNTLETLEMNGKLQETIWRLMLSDQRALFDHLLSSALFCFGIATKHPAFNNMSQDEKRRKRCDAILAGLLSDIEIDEPENFEPMLDRGALHAIQSADVATQCGLSEVVVDAIRLSHSYESQEEIPFDKYIAHFLCLCEYYHSYIFLCHVEKPGKTDAELLEEFFFDQGYVERLSIFDEFSVNILATTFDGYQSAMQEGRQVSQVVDECTYPDEKGSSAVPYPLSRSVTQILCRCNKTECPNFDEDAGDILFAKDTVHGNLLTSIALNRGAYGKCKLETRLPAYAKAIV